MKSFVIYLVLSGVATHYFIRFTGWLLENAVNAIVTFFLFYSVLWLLSFFYDKAHFKKAPLAVGLILFFTKELIIASLRIAYDIVTPNYSFKPGVVAFPLEAKSDLEITILANLITLTPGTLSLDVSEDRKILYVHAIYLKNGNTESVKESIKKGFERKLLKITR